MSNYQLLMCQLKYPGEREWDTYGVTSVNRPYDLLWILPTYIERIPQMIHMAFHMSKGNCIVKTWWSHLCLPYTAVSVKHFFDIRSDFF